jgi:hypothetical protein
LAAGLIEIRFVRLIMLRAILGNGDRPVDTGRLQLKQGTIHTDRFGV